MPMGCGTCAVYKYMCRWSLLSCCDPISSIGSMFGDRETDHMCADCSIVILATRIPAMA